MESLNSTSANVTEAVDVPDLVARMSSVKRAAAERAAESWFAAALKMPLHSQMARTRMLKSGRFLADTIVNHRTEKDLLHALLKVGRYYGLRRIRYYHYSHGTSGGELVSMDCAGHDAEQAVRLRLGNILKCRAACPPDWSDSFLCLERGWPVAFQIDPTCPEPMREGETIGRLPVVVLVRSQCEDVLGVSPFRFRVDYPLTRAGMPVGKLSCDLGIRCLDGRAADRLIRFWRVAMRIAAPLAALQAGRMAILMPAADQVRDRTQEIQDLRTLFDYCVEELPKGFNFLHASIFTICADATGSRRLVLRRTSYADSRDLEDGAVAQSGRWGYYQIAPNPDNAITAWVARTGRSLRLQHLGDSGLLDRQLKALDPELRWMNKIQDSGSHTSFLAVPIMAGGKVIGVLRFTEKAAGDSSAYFTDLDEKCLTRIASDHIGPRLAELQRSESKQIFCKSDWQQPVVKALTETFRPLAPTDKDRRQASFRLAIQQIFREKGRAHHLCLVNKVTNSTDFIHLAAVGSLAPQFENRMGRTFELKGTLTERVILERRTIYLHDIRRAEEEGLMVQQIPSIVSVLACPIFLGAQGSGAILLHSDRHDLLPEKHGPLLEYLTQLTADILTCRCRVGN